MIRFMVPGNPIPKQRPRFNGHAYTPKETERAEQWIQMHARKAKVRWTDKPVRLVVRFYRENGQCCDLDNLVKLVSDALNGIAWKDDRQVVELVAAKDIDRAHPRTEVEVWHADEPREMASLEDDLGKEPEYGE